jgi:hypothetical protein
MIHDFDTHFWLAKLKDGKWISAEEHSTADDAFNEASFVRIEPISKASIWAVLQSAIPEGYAPFLRTNVDQPLGGGEAKLSYMLALERGTFPNRASLSLSELHIVDGFRAELRGDGTVDFKTSSHFGYHIFHEDDMDIYDFRRI